MNKKLLGLFLVLMLLSFGTDSTQNKAPEIKLKNTEGKEIKLSDLRGKMVLIDFWASWCRPCRMENPNVVEAYEKYNKSKFKNGKGFEVFSVSLDKNEDAWKAAIAKDNLHWSSHVWDVNGSASREYNVQFIPTAFLIDGEGNIVAQGQEIRGLNLHTTMDELLK